MTLNELATTIRDINWANGWDVTTLKDWSNPNKLGTKLALVHSEVSEALEAIRKGDKESFGEELADTLIRVLDIAAGLEIDMDEAVSDKLVKNRLRGHRHGGKAI